MEGDPFSVANIVIVTALVTIVVMSSVRSRHGFWPMAHGVWQMARPSTIAICHLPLAMTLACSEPAPVARLRAHNVLLVTIDTFRADRVGTGVAPTIDRLAAAGTHFTAARTAVPLTLPSHATIHTGLLPPAHGVRQNGIDALADTHQTIARLLKTAGYDTGAFVGAFVLDRRFGLAQGFDTYDDRIPRDPNATERLEAERPASAVIDSAIAWLDRRTRDQGPRTDQGPRPKAQGPFFMWIHLYDPHAPYNPPSEFRARSRSPYDGEIAYADAQLGRLLEWLRARGEIDRTLIVVAGDHGEGLGDHGERTHGMLLYDSTVRVPLIVVAPGRPAGRRDDPVSLTDLAPTILRAAGVAVPDVMKGRDLLSTVRLKADTTETDRLKPDRDRDLYSETEYPLVAGWSPLQALTDGRWMAIRAGASTEVYDLQNDPREEHDVAAAQPAIAAAMASRAEVLHTSETSSQAHTISADARERLRTLGYVASSVQPGPATGARNPATTIATWNDFEDALSALAARVPDAVGALRKLASANPDAPVLQATYAGALKEAGQVQAALTIYRQAARRWPTDATLLHDLAVAARDAANAAHGTAARAMRDEARRSDEAALALDANSAIAHNGLGLLAIDNDQPGDAVKAFERAAAIDPNNASYWTNLGNARRVTGDRGGAEQAFRRALDVDARAADAANGLGVLLVEAHRAAEAAPWFERAIGAAPDLVEARLNLGIALQGAGNAAGAAEAYRLVLAARGNHPREKDSAAKLLAALGAVR
jgi:arylsulfatase A-like enzyme/Tfp pilus assembly protein PilF